MRYDCCRPRTAFHSVKHAKSAWQRIADGMKSEVVQNYLEYMSEKIRNIKWTYKTINDNDDKTRRGEKNGRTLKFSRSLSAHVLI